MSCESSYTNLYSVAKSRYLTTRRVDDNWYAYGEQDGGSEVLQTRKHHLQKCSQSEICIFKKVKSASASTA